MRPQTRFSTVALGLAVLILAVRPAAGQLGGGISLALGASQVVSCGTVTGAITLAEPVAEGARILLRADSDVVALPAGVDVPPGAARGVFVARVGPTRNRTRARITAIWGAHTSTALLTIRPPVAYAVEDLGTLGGATSAAMAINAGGQVAGVSRDATGRPRGFITDAAGRMRPVGTGPAGDGAVAVHVAGLNDSGRVAGWLENAAGVSTAFVSNGNGEAVPLNVPGAARSKALGINNTGAAAGWFSAVSGQDRAFWMAADGSVTSLETFPDGSFSYAFALTPEGAVVGYADDGNRVFTYRTHPGERISSAARIGPDAYGYAVNAAGATAGEFYSVDDGYFHAFRADPNGTMRDLGTLPGHDTAARGLNASGVVVGFSYVLGGPDGHAVIYTDADGLRDLNDLIAMDSGWELIAARAINDAGQIAGYGLHNGALRAFRLKPLAVSAHYGDANADGIITVADAREALLAAGGLGRVADARAADVAPSPGCRPEGFGDDRVDLLDVLRLLRRVRGLETAWP